jgi:hypothetical protein
MNQYNDKGHPHGYWKYHSFILDIGFKGNYINGTIIGYWEWYDSLIEKQFFL